MTLFQTGLNQDLVTTAQPSSTSPAHAYEATATQTQAGSLNLAVVAFVAMFVAILMWSDTRDAPTPPMGNNQNYLRMVLVLFAASAATFVLLRNPRAWVHAFPGPVLLLFLYGVVAAISSSFVPEYAFYSLWKALEVVVVVLVTAAVLSYTDGGARTMYHALLILNIILTVVYAIEAAWVPALVFDASRGILPIKMRGLIPVAQANALAFLSAVSAFGLLCALFRPAHWLWKLLCAGLCAVALVVLVLAQSRTSFVAFCLAVVVYLIFDRRLFMLACLFIVVLVAGVYASFFDIFSQYLLRGQDAELVASFSGRTTMWSQAWIAFQDAPILGQGFAAYARAAILGAEDGASSLHGAVFEVIVGAGAVGLLLWGGGILWTCMRLAFLPRWDRSWFQVPVNRSMRAEMLGVALMVLIRGSTSSGLAEHEDSFMLFLSVLVYTMFTERRLKAKRQAEVAAQGQPDLLYRVALARSD